MLMINGLKRFFFLPGLYDMRVGHVRLSEIVRGRYNSDPRNGDVYVFMSKDRRRVKLFHYQDHAYYVHQKCFEKGYKFVRVECDGEGNRVWRVEWQDLAAIMESPVVQPLRLRGQDKLFKC